MDRYDFPRRKCIRLREYDYSRAGAYFITICVEDKLCIFGRIENAEMNLSPIGRIVADQCLKIPNRFTGVEIDCFVVMPNHMHAIIVLPDCTEIPGAHNLRRGEVPSPGDTVYSFPTGATPSPGDNPDSRHRKGAVLMPIAAHPDQLLGRIVAWYKYLSTKSVTELSHGKRIQIWQRGYHDHIVRDETDLQNIREYIENNPLKWELDRYYRAQ